MKFSVFIGVDLGETIRRKSTGLACLLEKNGKPFIKSPPLHIISDDACIRLSIQQMSENFRYKTIAIDAPLSLPEHGSMRECERRLRKRGIACFPSGAKWVSKWVNKAIELKGWAEKELGASVIEVYPYASRRALGMDIGWNKKSKKGRQVIQDNLLGLIKGMDEVIGDKLLSDDELDAIISAYTAYLEGTGNAIKIDGLDGVIYIPLKRLDHKINEY